MSSGFFTFVFKIPYVTIGFQIKGRKFTRVGTLKQGSEKRLKFLIVKICFIFYDIYPADIYLFKFSNKKTRRMCGICSNIIMKTAEQHLKFSDTYQVFSLLTSTSKCRLGYYQKVKSLVLSFQLVTVQYWMIRFVECSAEFHGSPGS